MKKYSYENMDVSKETITDHDNNQNIGTQTVVNVPRKSTRVSKHVNGRY